MRSLVAVILALGIASATTAHATDVAGWYAGIYAGPSLRSDVDIATAIGTGGFNFGSSHEYPPNGRDQLGLSA